MSTIPEPPAWPYLEPPPGPDSGARRRPIRWRLLSAAVVIMAGAGAFLALNGIRGPVSGTSGTGGSLTAAQVAAKVDPGLVDVNSTLSYQHAGSAGTGIVLTANGEVLTNNHVINGATSVTVTDIGNGRTYQATVLGYSKSSDIALLQLKGASGLTTAPLGDSATAIVGQKIVTLGNALGKGGAPSAETGQITELGASVTAADSGSGTTEHLTGLIAHDANIQPGDSGGPLVSMTGQVIGVDTAASAGLNQAGQTQTQAVAIPINEALAIARQIESGTGSASVHIGPTAFLGVQVATAEDGAVNGVPIGSGALVNGVVTGAPAEGAGLAAGDVITGVGSARIDSPATLAAALLPHHPGDRIKISWTDRAGQAQSASLVLTSGPAG